MARHNLLHAPIAFEEPAFAIAAPVLMMMRALVGVVRIVVGRWWCELVVIAEKVILVRHGCRSLVSDALVVFDVLRHFTSFSLSRGGI